MTELITVTLYENNFHLSHRDRHNPDGSITILNISTEVDKQGNIVNEEITEGLTVRYE